MSLTPVAAPFMASSALLVLAGVAKIARPGDTTRALRAAGISAGRPHVRAGAVAELAVGVAALAAPGALTGSLVAVSYAGFAAFIALSLRNGWPISSCGCLGRADTRPTAAHLVLDIGAVAAAAVWASDPPASLGAGLSGQPWDGWPLALVAAVIVLVAYVVWTNPLRTGPGEASRIAGR